MCRSTTICALSFLFGFAICYPYESIPVGLILREGDAATSTVIRYGLWSRRSSAARSDVGIEIIKETADLGDPVQVDKAVCRLLKRGIVAILSQATPSSYPILVKYSNEFNIPLLSPELPEVPSELSSQYGVGLLPVTTGALLQVLRLYRWRGIVYIYDDQFGTERLQQLFLRGYRALNLQLVGLLRTTSAEEANLYLRKLDMVKKGQPFHVILDTRPEVAKDIIVRHVHDVHVRKNNFHFFLKQPALEDFWLANTAEFGSLNVTGFLVIQPEWPAYKNFKEEWKMLAPNMWEGAGTNIVNMSTYFYYDAAVLLFDAFKKHNDRYNSRSRFFHGEVEPRDCRQYPPIPVAEGKTLSQALRMSNLPESLTGKLRFDYNGRRSDFEMDIVETFAEGYLTMGTWQSSRQSISTTDTSVKVLPTPSALTGDKKKIITKLSPPYMMLAKDANGSHLVGNDRFEGYCKDLLDLLAAAVPFEYNLELVEDNLYGKYNENDGWSGIIGEVVRGKADIAVADLTITGERQKVLYFTDPFHMVSFSVIMLKPNSVLTTSSPYFFLTAFAPGIWVCVLVSAIVACAMFYYLTIYTGEPDSLESATGMWGRKFSVSGSVWFFLGSSLFQSSGIYPRSISSRLLGGTWWFFTLIIACLYIASLTTQFRVDNIDSDSNPQLLQLQALSVEAIIKESVARGWPKVGIVRNSNIAKFIKKSNLPTYEQFTKYLRDHPEVTVETVEEGLEKVRTSNGGYMMMVESQVSEYRCRQKPCDTVAVHDTTYFAGYGVATKLRSPIESQLKTAMSNLHLSGMLGQLHRKWWIETNQCNQPEYNSGSKSGTTLHSVSGMFYILLVGMLILAFVSGGQYFWKTRRREDMRRKLSFEDMNLGPTSLPLPPPEMLEPPIVEEASREISGWAERSLVPTSFRNEPLSSGKHDTNSS